MGSIYKNKLALLMIVLITLFAGIYKLIHLPVSLYPDVKRPAYRISLNKILMNSDDFYAEYGQDLESKLSSISGVNEVHGTYENAKARWKVEFNWGVDYEKAKTDLGRTLSEFESRFPEDWGKFDYHLQSNQNAFVAISLASDKKTIDEIYYGLKDQIAKNISQIPGVDNGGLSKPTDKQIKIELKADLLLQYHINAEDVYKILRDKRYDSYLGKVDIGDSSYHINVVVKDKSLDDLKSTIIENKSGRILRLSDIANVSYNFKIPDWFIRSNGKPGIIVFGNIKSGANISQASDDFESMVYREAKNFDPSIEVQTLLNPSKGIKSAINSVYEALGVGVLISILVVFLFLGSIRYTLIVGISLPLSIIGGFILMDLIGLELNLISLGAMALSVGMVVDGSIVVLENIARHFESHKNLTSEEKFKLVLKAVLEVRIAVIASLLTTIIVFVPLVFTTPMTNALLGDLAKVIVCVLVLSIVVTILFVPPFFLFLSDIKGLSKDRFIYWPSVVFNKGLVFFENLYLRTLKNIICSRKKILLGLSSFLILILFSLFLMQKYVPKELVAVAQTDKIWLSVVSQKSHVEQSQLVVYTEEVELILNKEFSSEINYYFSQIGNDSIYILIEIKDKRKIKEFEKKLESYFVNTPYVHYGFSPWNPGGLDLPEVPALAFYLLGDDFEEKMASAQEIKNLLSNRDELSGVEFSPKIDKKKFIDIKFHEDELVFLQKNGAKSFISKIKDTLSFSLQSKKVSDLKIGADYLPIEISFGEKYVNSIADFSNMFIPINNQFIPIRKFVDFKYENKWAEFYTQAGQRVVRGEVLVKNSKKPEEKIIGAKLQKELEALSASGKAKLSFMDPMKDINENIQSLFLALIIAILLVWLVVSCQFSNLWQTIVILSVIPLGIAGASISLFVFSSTLCINSMLGMILLAGTAVNNSIIYVDFLNHGTELQGLDKITKLIETAKLRFRPILITTGTTILGMIPMAIGLDDGGEIIRPLGIAVAGGICISTFLMFYAVPMLLALKKDFN